MYDAAVAAMKSGQGGIQIQLDAVLTTVPLLRVAGQELAPWVHSPQGRQVLAMPGRDVPIRPNSITPTQVNSHRPSYINGILIQSRGTIRQPICTERARRGLSLFVECRAVAGHFGGSCGNCKWRDHAARFTAGDDDDDNDDGDDNGTDDDDEPSCSLKKLPSPIKKSNQYDLLRLLSPVQAHHREIQLWYRHSRYIDVYE